MIAIPPGFDEKLRALAAGCASEGIGIDFDRYLPVFAKRPFLWLFKRNQVYAHIWVAGYDDHWRVMYSPKPGADGSVWGVHYRMHHGHDVDSGVLSIWKFISKEWQPCDASEAAAIRERIETAVDIAYQQKLATRTVS